MKRPNYIRASEEAHALISQLNIKNPPVDPLDIAEYLGVTVTQIEMPEKFSKVAGFLDFKNREIIINSKDSSRKKAFSIAHELGHFVLHSEKFNKDSSFYQVLFRAEELNDTSPEEREANTFAACLLTPRQMLETYRDVPDSIKAKIFGVPTKLLSFRNKY